MIIGVTGLIGSGKSTAARIMQKHGAALIDADLIARQVVADYPVLLKKLASRYGKGILTPAGRLSRAKLAAAAFADAGSTKQLNDIVHPYIRKEIRLQMTAKSRRSDLVVVDAALLLSSPIADRMDSILVIHAGRSIRVKRLLRRGMAASDIQRRMRVQLPFAEFRRRADRLILNSGTLKSLEKKVIAYLKKIGSKGPENL